LTANKTLVHVVVDTQVLKDTRLILFLERKKLSALINELLKEYLEHHEELPRELWELYHRTVR
jgi:hypothetical protein